MDRAAATIPSDFLIDERGTVIEVFRGRHIGDHVPFARVVEVARG